MKIGILTYHHAHNYGAFLQACALCNRLNSEENLECELIDFRMQKEVNFYSLSRTSRKVKYLHPSLYRCKKQLFSAFEAAQKCTFMKKSHDNMLSDSIDDFVKFVSGKYDVIVTGSDEIWKIDGYRGFPTPYWLPDDLKCGKFAYAASSRSDFSKLDAQNKQMLTTLVNDFEFIGVREQITADQLKSYVASPEKIHVCCDPTFLYDFPIRKGNIQKLFKDKIKLNPKKKNIVVMTNIRNVAKHIYNKFSKSYNLISVFSFHKGYTNAGDISPIEWLELIANADLVISSYFHGTCLSIVKQTPFITIGSNGRDSKIRPLFFEDNCNFVDRYIPENDFIKQVQTDEQLEVYFKKVDTTEYVNRKRAGFPVFLEALNQYAIRNSNKI